ncbi:prolyl aminopeptidase [bacterium]|nr:prolyl aminopeptidase [bacterium]
MKCFLSLSLILTLTALPAAFAQEHAALWPKIESFDSGYLQVSDLHSIYYDRSGNPDGVPVFVLHGGPGGSTSPYYRRFCDPTYFQIVLHDQRGAGRSKPYAETRENTTWDLVEDIEQLRKHIGAERIVLFGGSWGTTLGLAYAERYPDRVLGLVLRGVFTATKEEIDWFYHGGTAHLFPDQYRELLDALPDPDRRPLPAYLYELLQSPDSLTRAKYARAWTKYEAAASKVDADSSHIRQLNNWLEGNNPLSFALFENYYMANDCFLEPDQLWKDIDRIRDIPAFIVNGRFDAICPPITAWRLYRALPHSRLVLTFASGHSMAEPNTEAALVQGFEWLKTKLEEK